MPDSNIWDRILARIETKVNRHTFYSWFKTATLASDEGQTITVRVPNTLVKNWLKRNYAAVVDEAMAEAGRPGCHVEFIADVVDPADADDPLEPLGAEQPVIPTGDAELDPVTSLGGLIPRYSFDTFVVGPSNQFAEAACRAVAEAPSRSYNPLFIYGGVGLGKTHLLQAIGHKMIEMNSRAKVLYVTSERFTNEFIHSVRSGRAKDFKDTYRNVDLLMIDDIQFITGKEGTQEEFHNTFNTLHQANKQIIMSSDRPPKAIQGIEQRLVSRFEWGMIVDISTPDLETRIAILESKCKERGCELSREILSFIAAAIHSNVRELEGALNKIIAYHQFKNTRPTLESVRELLSSVTQAGLSKKNLTAKMLLDTVAAYFDIAVPDLLGKCREKRLAFPRQIIMYLMREELKSSYPAIGKTLGGRDHTTAIHAYGKINREIQEDEKLKHDLNLIKQRLYATGS